MKTFQLSTRRTACADVTDRATSSSFNGKRERTSSATACNSATPKSFGKSYPPADMRATRVAEMSKLTARNTIEQPPSYTAASAVDVQRAWLRDAEREPGHAQQAVSIPTQQRSRVTTGAKIVTPFDRAIAVAGSREVLLLERHCTKLQKASQTRFSPLEQVETSTSAAWSAAVCEHDVLSSPRLYMAGLTCAIARAQKATVLKSGTTVVNAPRAKVVAVRPPALAPALAVRALLVQPQALD